MSKNANVETEITASDDLLQESVERIRQCAYHLYEAQGWEEGHEKIGFRLKPKSEAR